MATVDGKLCTYISRYGSFKTFSCGEYEMCCKNECCGMESEFYTLWYFWAASFLLLSLVGGLSYITWRRWLKKQTTDHNSSTVENQLILDCEKEDIRSVQPVSPPPYKHSPPSYASQESICLPPPYKEKDYSSA